MLTLLWTTVFTGTCLILAYRKSGLLTWILSIAVVLSVAQFTIGVSLFVWTAFLILAVLLSVKPLRRQLLTPTILRWFHSVLPPISETEAAAIDAGSVWWDGELFSGSPRWDELLQSSAASLTSEEEIFLSGPTETLCEMLNDWEINSELNDLPDDVWRFLKDERFFGMLIPKEYGGLGFSPRAQSEVVMKVATRSIAAAVTIMVPNSLGPGELLLHYGSNEQRSHYLPRLACGQEIPAFALTSTWAGSDAAAMIDEGVVEYGEFGGERVLGIRLTWEKRYITLAPVCTLLGLAFKARDPERLLGGSENPGITCALIPTDLPGISIGERHDPGCAFQNGSTRGTDVFVPIDFVVGGADYVGQGWRMLMDCLSVGRAISLPALGTATGKLCSRVTGAYARVRKQFKVPIGSFEGIEERLARIGGVTYRMDASRIVTAGALNLGEKPAILSAILKYHNTEGMRTVVTDAMDIHGGRGVIDGPSNYLRRLYDAVPVAITVEGANILTRSLIIFGQGAIRCHPYVLSELRASENPDRQTGLRDFDDAFFAHVGHSISNGVRAFVMGVTGARFVSVPDSGLPKGYLRRMTHLSAAFSFVTDVAMLTLGGELKRREKLSGRLGDILSHLYMASAVVKHYNDSGRQEADLPFVEWALQDSLQLIEKSLSEVLENLPRSTIGWVVRRLVIPLGETSRRPNDRLTQAVARLLLEPSAARDRLTDGMYLQQSHEDVVGVTEVALEAVLVAEPLEKKIYQTTGSRVTPQNLEAVVQAALKAGAIDQLEAQQIRHAMKMTQAAISVDTVEASRSPETMDSKLRA